MLPPLSNIPDEKSSNLKCLWLLFLDFYVTKHFSIPCKPLVFGLHRAGSYDKHQSLPQNTRSQKFKDEVLADEMCSKLSLCSLIALAL